VSGDRLWIETFEDARGATCQVFVRPELSGTGKKEPLVPVVTVAESAEKASYAMQKMLHTATCDLAAKLLGESLDARGFGAAMEYYATHPTTTATADDVMGAVTPIALKARAFRQAINRFDRRGNILDSVLKRRDIEMFRLVLDTLCEMPTVLKNRRSEWTQKATRGPKQHGSVEDWLTMCFAHTWGYCVGTKVSTAERSRFMRVAREFLPTIGVEMGNDARGMMQRRLRRLGSSIVTSK
jgi:hypothetical protein